MRYLTIPLAFALTTLTACGAFRTHEARDPQGALIGSNILDLVQSVGIPDKTMKLVDTGGPSDRMEAQWNFANSDAALDLNALVLDLKIGGAGKCSWCQSLGADVMIDYKKDGSLVKKLHDAAPLGIDVYFDNVGGEHLDAALASASLHARFAICGMIDAYNSGQPTALRYALKIISARIRIQGFLVSDYMAQAGDFYREMGGLLQAGKLQSEETVFEGLDAMPEAFLGLFSGGNTGKMLVKT